MDLLSNVALLKAAQLKKVLKKSKQDTYMLHASGSVDRVGSQLKVLDELHDKTTSTNEGTDTISGVPDVPKDQFESENESWGDSGDDDDSNDDDNNNDVDDDEDVHESDDDHDEADDERTESNDEKEEKQDDEFLYGDVNISLKDTETADKEKGDVEMTIARQVNVNQEGAGNLIKDDVQATQKTEVDIEVVSMLDINVQHKVLRTSPLLTILVSVILEHTVVNPPEIVITVSLTTSSSLLSSLFPHLQQLTPIPTPTKTKATTSTTDVFESETLTAFHQRITNLEKDVKELKIVDHSAALLSTIKSEVPNAVKEYLGTSLDDALHKVLQKHLADIIKEHYVPAEIIERLRQQYVPKKSAEDIRKIKIKHARKLPKQGALYHALMKSILEDEDAIDEGVADKLKKRKHDDADKGEGPSAGLDRGLKRRKTSKDTKPSKKAKSTETSKGTSKSQPKSTVKSAQAEEIVFEAGDTQQPQNQGQDMGDTDDQPNVKAASKPPQTWISKIAQAEKPPLSFDELISTPIDFSAYVMNHLKIDKMTQEHLVGPTFNLLKGTCKSRVKLEYNFEECYKALTDRLDWNNPEGKEYPFDLSKPLPLIMVQGIKDMVPSLWSPIKVEYLQLGVECYQKKLNITKPKTYRSDISKKTPYIAYSNPQGIIYVDKYKRNTLMRTDELYKFSDGTLMSVRFVLHDIASNLRIDYLPKRRWSNLDRQRSRIMIKAIDKLMLERRLMRSLEKFVGGREYREDFRLLERTI
ncbi:hypothetical protein Tco_0577754 [Tanacetum coccineum]